MLFLLLIIFHLAESELNVTLGTLNGTECLKDGLTDKQLAIQKYLAWLTILQPTSHDNSTAFGWKGWEVNYNNDQKDLPAVRYPLSFIGYAIAATIYKTPMYKELSIKVLDNVIQRLIEKHQYEYIESYWKHEKTFPDPVIHENIMYSGHLAQLIALYESISADYKYTNVGWYFKWSNESSIHYTASKLMQILQNQTFIENTGGIACEPNSIFIICNNHPRIATQLYDSIHSSNYSNLNLKWENWMKKHGKAPHMLPTNDYRFFRIIYYKPIHAWIPLYGTSGNDVWALAFMNLWMNDKKFTREGFERLFSSTQWRNEGFDQEYLDAGVFGKISELNTWLASSLYPIVEKQYLDKNGTNKSAKVFNWFETNFGQFSNINDNKDDKIYLYNISDPNYKIWTTSNLFLGMIINDTTLNQMYSIPNFNDGPQLIEIDYPSLHVSSAQFDKEAGIARFSLKTDTTKDVNGTAFKIINVTSFKVAIQKYGANYKNITNQVEFNFNKRTLQFRNINITYDQLNTFIIQF